MFKILAGKGHHPYLSDKESRDIFSMTGTAMDLTAAAFMFDAPGVQWPEGVRESYPEDLVAVVERLLSRHRNRAGLQEVRPSEVELIGYFYECMRLRLCSFRWY